MDYPECIVMDRLMLPPKLPCWEIAEAQPLSWQEEFDITKAPTVRIMRYERDLIWSNLWWRVR